MAASSFVLLGSSPPASPVIVSVPHAGRDYPQALCANLRVPLAALRPLEDRHIDAVATASRTGQTMLVQRTPRAWIDLNRGEDERDPKVDKGASAKTQPNPSPKLRSGLGLVPRRVSVFGDLWQRRFEDADIAARIAADHRPYHAALAQLLTAARARFGVAVLLDLHSMPPLGPAGTAPRIVVGDRFGQTATDRLVACVETTARAYGHVVARNAPYAGGHILARHGAPGAGIHAIQLEIDRSLYLDAALDLPGPGLVTVATMVGTMLAALADEAMGRPQALAAE